MEKNNNVRKKKKMIFHNMTQQLKNSKMNYKKLKRNHDLTTYTSFS